MQLHTTIAGVLDVAYYDAGPRQGPPVVLLHGFPYDVHACRAAGDRLAQAGCRVVTPYLRGFGLVAGDPALDDWERALVVQPSIGVPTISIDGAGDGVMTLGGSAGHQHHFNGPYAHRVLPLVGHNLPQEAPEAFASAVLELL